MVDPQETYLPSARPEMIEARAQLYRAIRTFFSERDVLEVEVPLLGSHFVTDPYIPAVVADNAGSERFLQSSPEYAMKRLLAAMPRCIYSLGKAFRAGERSARHNPEFTLLEWYRLGFDDRQLMAEVRELVVALCPGTAVQSLSYRQWFEQSLGVDPHTATLDELRATGLAHIEIDGTGLDRNDWLDLLVTHTLEPAMVPGLTFIYDYPASQAALARVLPDESGVAVARRFEAFFNGMELANGYWELTDPAEQRERFAADRARRRQLGLPDRAGDNRLLAALEHGLAPCAGVALGVDRLLMQREGCTHIRQVLAFDDSRA
ncbi:EF-P lysine aminoacylase EpmA [Gilvimarinus algae]|uniref:EF-P lysine aminoacylase EpmA n=1 Tax=Gilvimarinus algae TaxID=3058037 RepID=A0ABT8TH00_9GAMM|nr:EF-P lysine aminoacylase EpmA [Gilvimarinus sp. SDUM040014]MDO3383328.1 EF-P lysine aminoacylase EpmA [Gilvimarinus sp. SDUM040014]